MKYLKMINDLYANNDVDEILSHDGWEIVSDKKHEHWDLELRYKLSNKVSIQIVKLEGYENLNYYLETESSFNFVSTYGANCTSLYSEHVSPYRDLSEYDRMMKICKYLLPFYEKEPSDEFKDNIRECFIEIEDELSKPEIDWGYSDNKNSDFGYFPAYRFTDRLGLFLIYDYRGNEDKIDSIKKEFNYIKDRLNDYDIHESRVSLIDDDWRIIIKIDF